MDNNVERIRDAMAGAIVGALFSVVIFIISIINAALHLVSGLFTGGSSFQAMSGGTFGALIVVFMLIGGAIGFGLGYYVTQESTMRKSVQTWMAKHNH